MSKAIVRAVGVLCAAGLVAAGGCGRGGRTAITVAGSTAFQPFAEKLAEQFMVLNPGVNVTVQGGGSAVGIQSALSGAADIGMADLVTLPPEAAALASVIVARDGIAVVVNPANPVGDLSSAQVRDLFSGRVANWKDAGGADHAVTVVSREAGSGTRSSFEQTVGESALSPDAIVQDSNGTIRETVANDAFAIGYLSHGLVNDRIKPVRIDGAESSTEEIMAGSYKLVRPVYLLTRGEPAGEAKAFIDYVLSEEGQRTIRTSGLIPAK